MPLSVIDSTGLASPLTGLNNPTIVGNMTFSTSNGGIVFNPSTLGSGHTSNTLTDYEIGTWTPIDGSGGGGTVTAKGTYTKIGTAVYAWFSVGMGSSASGTSIQIAGFPFVTGNPNSGSDAGWAGVFAYNQKASGDTIYSGPSTTSFFIYTLSTQQTNASYSGKNFEGVLIYQAST